MSFRGLGDTGRPPRFNFPRLSISVLSCGKSRYSFGRMECASTRDRSDFKERRDALFLAVIGFPHAEYVASVAPGRVPNDNHAASEQAVADDARFAIVLALVLNFKGDAGKNERRIIEVEPSISQRLCVLGWIEGYPHGGYCNYNNRKKQSVLGKALK
jgi:hypothetical protein